MDEPSMMVRRIAVITGYTSAILASNYALTALPNVKLFDFLVFLAACLYGLPVGLSVASLSWLVYGTINPYGASPAPLLVLQIVGELGYAFLGFLVARLADGEKMLVRGLIFGLCGSAGAAAYDLLTNAFVGVVYYGSVWTGLITGIPFAVIHNAANFIIFSTLTPPVLMALSRMGSYTVWRRERK